MRTTTVAVASLLGSLCACGDSSMAGRQAPGGEDGGPGSGAIERTFGFSSADGWTHSFSDLPVGQDDFYELEGGLTAVEVPGAGSVQGYGVRSNNHSDDVWMYLARSFGQQDGIRPGQAYLVSAEIAFVTTAPTGCGGIGGAPGESVVLKLGASPLASASLRTVDDNQYRFVPDKGNQSTSGAEVSVVSDIASGRECPDTTPALLRKTHAHAAAVRAGAEGTLTVIVGTDSGFEGATRIVYDEIKVRLEPAP